MKFRPTDDPRNKAIEGDPNPGSPVEWEDNALSNTFAWGSHKFTPGWCQTPEHWTSRFANYLWTDCPCCMLFRGIVVGLFAGIAFSWVLFVLVIVVRVFA